MCVEVLGEHKRPRSCFEVNYAKQPGTYGSACSDRWMDDETKEVCQDPGHSK